MTPSTPGVGEDPSFAGTHPAIGYALAPISGAAYPDPQRLKAELAAAFEDALLGLRRERGLVCLPEDTHKTIRRVHDVIELAKLYADAFSALAKRGVLVLGEELNEGMGEQDGIPNGAMRIPHNGAMIRLSPDYTSTRSIDLNQVLTALVMLVADEWKGQSLDPREDPQTFAVECIHRALSDVMTKAEPKPTGVEALAVLFGHRGDDQMAAVVRSAVGKPVRRFSKVKVEYKPDAA